MINFKPKACFDSKDEDGKAIPAKFKGTVEIDPPDFEERYEYIDDSGFDLTQSEEPSKEETRAQIRAVRKLVGMATKHVTRVSLKHLETGRKYETLDELMKDPNCDGILMEIGVKMGTGFTLGKPTGSDSRPKQKPATKAAG